MGSSVSDLTQGFVNANGGSRDLNAQNVNAFLQQLQAGGSYDPAAAFSKAKQYWGQSPADAYGSLRGGLQQAGLDAGQFADQSTQLFGQSMMGLAQQQSTEGRRALEQRFAQGGTFGVDSGAARAALGQAVMQPFAAADAQVASKRADAYSAFYQPQAQMMAQNYYGMGDRYANQGNGYLGALAGLSQQAYIAPQFQQANSKGSNALSGAASGAAAGSITGWPGALAGGVLGGLGGYFS